MRRTAMSLAAAAALTLAVVAFGGTPAGAQQGLPCLSSTANPAAVSAANINPGDALTITGGGFAPNQVLSIGLAQPPVVLATVASNTNGDYQTFINTPPTTPAGQNQIIVFGRGPNGTCHQSIALFNVIARPVPAPAPVQVFQQPAAQQQPVVVVEAPRPAVAAAAPVARAPLARTGSTTLTLGLTGLASLVGGAALLLTTRTTRRRQARTFA